MLSQLGNKIQHALRVSTPNEEKTVKVAARSFRQNPAFDTQKAISELGIGEALISMLDNEGIPTPVERANILPPTSRLTPLTNDERNRFMSFSPDADKYDAPIDRISAYEKLAEKAKSERELKSESENTKIKSVKYGKASTKKTVSRTRKADQPKEIVGDLAVSVAKSIGTQVGRELVRGILGSLSGSKKR